MGAAGRWAAMGNARPENKEKRNLHISTFLQSWFGPHHHRKRYAADPDGAAPEVLMKLAFAILFALCAFAQKRAEVPRPPLFFREDWKETPAATPVTAEHLTSAKLRLSLYGP